MSSACEGKERFASYALAERLRKVRRANSKLARQVYKCRECGGFHLGTSLQLQTRRLRGESYVTARDKDEAFA